MTEVPRVLDKLTDDEAYLFALLSDPSGIDQAEFLWVDHSSEDNIKDIDGERVQVRPASSACFRAWAFQCAWWRESTAMQVDQCVAGGQLVLTRSGWKPIEDVQAGDLVYTHQHRWRPVTRTWDRGEQEVVIVKGQGHPGLLLTSDHRIWARRSRRASICRDGHTGKRLLDPTWMPPKDWEWNNGSGVMVANWSTTPAQLAGAPKAPPIEQTPWCAIDWEEPAFLWLFGHFIAQGSTYVPGAESNHRTYRTTWSCNPDRVEHPVLMLRKLGLEPYVEERASVTCIHVTSKPLTLWLREQAGHLAHNKQLPLWVMGLDRQRRQAVLDGMCAGDGYQRGRSNEYTTVSWRLALSLKMLAASLDCSVSLCQSASAGECAIEGRIVQRRDGWCIRIEPLAGQTKPRCTLADGSLWVPVKDVSDAGRARVYDLEVEEDESFIVEGVTVHNCARAVGKSLSIKVRACAFPFLFPNQEMLITAPELIHLEPIVSLIEGQVEATRTLREMLPRGRSRVTHRPFQMNFVNGARILGRIPQRDGRGVKGCVSLDTLVLTETGFRRAGDVEVGEQLLTATGRYRPVIAIETDENDCYEVRGQSSFPQIVSCDHRFLGCENTATAKQKRSLLPLGWHDVEDLIDHQVYWATPTSFPSLPVPSVNWTGNVLDDQAVEFWWLIGRYLADGYLSSNPNNGKERRVLWVAPDHKQPALLHAIETIGAHSSVRSRAHSSADRIEVASAAWNRWLEEHFGRRAEGKRIPAWALGMDRRQRTALLEGYLAGDGHFDTKRKRWTLSTASKPLALGLQMLAQSLDYSVNCGSVQPKTTHINGVKLKSKPQIAWRLQILHGNPIAVGDHRVSKVHSITPVGVRPVVNLIVDDDHSYMSGSIVSHNAHPIWLELEEAQDYPHAGWVELRETLKRGWQGAMWRVHGVTRGVRDDFYEITQDVPGNSWKVHRFAGMWRPNWTDQERTEAIQKYGSRDDPDYRRNILGLHGDKTNPIFVLTQLMKNVDNDPFSDYNSVEYFKVTAKSEQLELFGQQITEVLDFPPAHLVYAGKTLQERALNKQAVYWVGMDIGFTIDPSEILVFVEYRRKPSDPHTTHRLLTRISLVRMPHREQIQAILHTIDFYRPRAFCMDKAGNGLPLYQELTEHIEAFRARDFDRLPKWMHAYDLEAALTTIKGYNFSEKLLVDLDPSVEIGPYDDTSDIVAKSGMKRLAKEYATDVLREMVDRQQLWLPWDDDLLKQFQGGTWTSNRSMDAYGRRTYSQGNDHCLDAARMFALGWSLSQIEELVRPEPTAPVLDAFISF
jgi:hypothetical protein